MAVNFINLNQVSLDTDMLKLVSAKTELRSPSQKLDELIVALATSNPLWNFVVTDVRSYANPKQVERVTVYERGEELGFISWAYFRGDYGFRIGNDRIRNARERSSSYNTHDVKKALASIKKTFTPKNLNERFVAAMDEARGLLNNQAYSKVREHNSALHQLDILRVEFSKSVQDMFVQYLDRIGKLHVLEKQETAHLEMETLTSMRDKFQDGKCALVIRADSGYIVKRNGVLEHMTDETMPDSMKAKVGMLKLVDDEHFITGVGGKVNTEVFVLAPEEGESK
jgi:hypothetical protein